MWLVGVNTITGNLPFRLSGGEFVVGRTKRAQIVIAETTVSRRHARLTCQRDSLIVEDLDSSNGTFVNEVAVERSPLQIGDHVRFGSVACVISASPLLLRSARETDSTHQIPQGRTAGETVLIHTFTPAQQAIVPHLMEGRSETEIAAILGKSRHTVHTHVKAMYERMGVHSREELIVKLLRQQ